MMKRIAIALAALLLLLTAGCGKNAPDASGATANNPTQSTTSPSGSGSNNSNVPASAANNSALPIVKKETQAPVEKVTLGPLAVGALAKVGLMDYKLEELAVVSKAGGLAPGYVYLVTKLTITNNTKDPFTINTSDHIKLEAPDGKIARYNVSATAQRNPRLQGTLQPGESQTGWLGYMIKVQEGKYKMTFTHPDFGQATYEFTP